MDKLKSIYASSYAAAIAIVVTVAITIVSELTPAFKTWLASFTGHHWETKSWASILVFIVMFVLIFFTKQSADQAQTKTALIILQITAVLGFVVILGFYVYEFFAH